MKKLCEVRFDMVLDHDISVPNIPMPNVTLSTNINKCGNCIKEDVCKYKEQFEKLNDLADNLVKSISESRQEYDKLIEIVENNIKCKKFNCNNHSEVLIRG